MPLRAHILAHSLTLQFNFELESVALNGMEQSNFKSQRQGDSEVEIPHWESEIGFVELSSISTKEVEI